MIITRSNARGHRTSRSGCRTNGSVERSHRLRSREPVVRARGGRVFFCGRISQHMKTSRLADWLAAGAMVLAVVSWGMLVSLLGN